MSESIAQRNIERGYVVTKSDIARQLASTTANNSIYKYYSDTSYKSGNIASLFSNADNFKNIIATNVAILTKNPAFATPSSLTSIGNISAKFDTLVDMYCSATLPLTNIRYSSFKFIENGAIVTKSGKRVALSDKAILSSNSYSWANNKNTGSKRLFSSKQDLLNYCGQLNSTINNMRANLVKDYNASQSAAPLISTETLARLSSSFVTYGLDYIAKNLSCKFEESIPTITITYFRNANGSGDKRELTSYAGIYYTISNYMWSLPADNTFLGWSTSPNQTTPNATYAPGKRLILRSNLNLYPVIKAPPPKWKIVYHKASTKIVNENNPHEDIVEDGQSYTIKGISSSKTAGIPLYYKSGTTTEMKKLFLGYSTTETGTVVFKSGAKISKVNKNYDLYPIFNNVDEEYDLNVYQEWQVNEPEDADKDKINPAAKFTFSGEAYATTGKHKNMKYGKVNGRTITGDTVPSVKLPFSANYISKIKLIFIGFINEENITHCKNAGKQARNSANVVSDGFARVYLSTLKLAGTSILNKLKKSKYSLDPASIKNWYNEYVKIVWPSGTIQRTNLYNYYYKRRNESVFKNKSFPVTDIGSDEKPNEKPIIFEYGFINQKGTDWPWPDPPNDNGTLNCFSARTGTISKNKCVLIETNWIDVSDINSSDTTLEFMFGIHEKCGGIGGSIGRVYLTNVQMQN